MKIYHNQLSNTLTKGFKPVWLIFGDEPWQKNNTLQQVKQAAHQQGFSELIRFYGDDKFDWYNLADEYQAMSLFASQRLIEVELPTGKVGDAGAKQLLAISEQLHQDVILILHGPKLDGTSQKRKWFKALEKQGCFVPLYELEGRHLQQWLQQQANNLQIKLSPELAQFMLTLFAGNLLALAQELEKLAILFADDAGSNRHPIALEQAETLMINQARFNPFQLIDALLVGDINQCVTMLDAMQQEGVAIGQLIWLLHKELVQVYLVKSKLDKTAPAQYQSELKTLFSRFKIWPKRQALYQQVLTNTSVQNIDLALSRLADVDLISKTSSEFNPFPLLADVCLSLYQGELTQRYSLDYLSSH